MLGELDKVWEGKEGSGELCFPAECVRGFDEGPEVNGVGNCVLRADCVRGIE